MSSPKEVLSFVERNADWFSKDKLMTAASIKYLDALRVAFPELTLAEQLDMVEEDIRVKFRKAP